jgi:hypothetical protein
VLHRFVTGKRDLQLRTIGKIAASLGLELQAHGVVASDWSRAMGFDTRLLLILTSDKDWPDRWLTVAQIRDDLERIGFWQRAPLNALDQAGRLEWLEDRLISTDDEGYKFYARIGGEYKHGSKMTEADKRMFEESKSGNILPALHALRQLAMGDSLPRPPKRLREPVLTYREFVEQTRDDVKELERLNQLLALKTEREPATGPQGESTSDVSRAINYFGSAAVLSYVARGWVEEKQRNGEQIPEELRQVLRIARKVMELYEQHVPDPE